MLVLEHCVRIMDFILVALLDRARLLQNMALYMACARAAIAWFYLVLPEQRRGAHQPVRGRELAITITCFRLL